MLRIRLVREYGGKISHFIPGAIYTCKSLVSRFTGECSKRAQKYCEV
jgi:hypothetical protein